MEASAEKAKTTPDVYPMSLNGISAGCNQKSNRAPLMQLEPADVEESLDRLGELGAVGLVEGYGRVQKYRHYLYDWLGVDKVELAVMTELLLRGEQTVGELRGRAARMEPIADLAALQPVLASLKSKRLVISLTPEGRGHVVTHALYKPREIEALQARHQAAGELVGSPPTSPPVAFTRFPPAPPVCAVALALFRDRAGKRRPPAGTRWAAPASSQLQHELAELRRRPQARTSEELQTLRQSLGG